MACILSAKEVHFAYGDGTKALNGASLSVSEGEKVAVLGVNGSGKSTLFLCLNGVLKPRAGSIEIAGAPISYTKKGLMEARGAVGIIFQDPESQLFCVNVREEVAFGPYNLGMRGAALNQAVNEALASCDLESLADRPPHFLSFGQKKRASIASVLSMRPKAIIYDEPMSALDPAHALQIEEMMNVLAGEGIGIVASTHDVDMALRWADKAVIMKGGIDIAVGPPEEIFTDEARLAEAGLVEPAAITAWRALLDAGIIDKEQSPPRDMAALTERIREARARKEGASLC